jgi:hypothetical protein
MHRRKLFESAIALAGSTFVCPLASAAKAGSTARLFVITRSKNANIVRYDVRLKSDGSLDSAQPMVAYWILAAENNRRESLSWLERRLAYGYEVTDVRDDGFRLRLAAFERRPLRVERDAAGAFRARTQIGNRPAFLRRVFVDTSERGVLPSVNYLELHGSDAARSTPVSERLVP